MHLLKNKYILVGICGGISAYKTLELIRLLKKVGAKVRAIPTNGATKFITQRSFEAISQNSCLADNNEVSGGLITHIEEAYKADLAIVAPATCNFLAKLTHGFADEILYQTLLSYRGPVILAPAMESNMWQNEATQENIKVLKKRKFIFAGPTHGSLASDRSGHGRMAEPGQIFEAAVAALSKKDFLNKKVLITAGPTQEDLDPVRFISNKSSGKMGVALARAMLERGAIVDFVHGPLQVELPKHSNIQCYDTKSANKMADVTLSLASSVDIAILCAAVCDFRPQKIFAQKMKKEQNSFENISWEKNIDILRTIGGQKNKPFLVGFAAETSNMIENAIEKCINKNCDLICANNVAESSAVFGSTKNHIVVVNKNNVVKDLKEQNKTDAAHEILDLIKSLKCPTQLEQSY
ncbi:bifunctional phosphopantothenoylcysteine decarboxylase/phosphopantothenate--cysteine ligase CoaBC [Sulfobacillus acidophilus]|uniref:Coenzyme A biosynthesis bifunctional protein CoaBC n=1 Tax=Sulfobacillus acidophilus TaxID=53633 RepID=A0ABS3AW26_9FIRM|nr:bifunctional phosphopantothenoylcysteine decarboxylase/phosphopantothenate--cysteine ligase CoaBC [Sulfobacillus acidophilus]